VTVADGLGVYCRERRYPPVASGLRRVLVLGHASITTDALRWCHERAVKVAVLGPNLELLVCSGTGADDARLRRQQALAPERPVGLEVTKMLLGAKLRGQLNVARSWLRRDDTADAIARLADGLEVADTLDECRTLEATAADVYFASWPDSPATSLRFARPEMSRGRIPAHWQRWDGRRSQLGAAKSNRRAERPLNAVLNLLYQFAEFECRLACVGVGLDPGVGVVHMDKAGRDSMALDLLEVVRPDVERFVLDLIAERTFRRRDFWQGSDGQVRVLVPLSHDLSATMPRWAHAVAPWAERVAHLVASGVETKIGRPTRLTGSSRRAAQATVKARKELSRRASERGFEHTGSRPAQMTSSRLAGCVDCGAPTSSLRRVRCDECIGADPRQTPTLRRSRGRAISGRRRREAEWVEASGGRMPMDPAWVVEVLRPALAGVTLPRVVEACSVTKSTASNWRNGRTNPHPMHWRILAQVSGVRLPPGWISQSADPTIGADP
jgi:CRISPR-associated endonuclease Cas1